MPFACGYCPTSSPDFKETISHLIIHHDREIKIEIMLRTLNFKIVPEMCHEQGRVISINDRMETIHVSKPNKVSKDNPLKKSLKQQVEHHNIQIMDSLGEKPGPKCSSITVEEHDDNLPLLSKCCQTLFRL